MCQKDFVYLCIFLIIGVQVRHLHCQNHIGTSPIIKKCSCQADEVLTLNDTRSDCQKRSPLFVHIWDKLSNEEEILEISSSRSVIVQPLQCPSNSVKDTFSDLAFISKEGKLMMFPFPETDLYCIEYMIDDSGKVSQRIERCTEKFTIRLCCETNEYMDSSERCTKMSNEITKNLVRKWLTNFNYVINRSVCDEGNLEHVRLYYGMPFAHLNDVFSTYEERTNSSFCLGTYGDENENEIYPGVTFCNSTAGDGMHEVFPPSVPFCCQDENHAFDIEKRACVRHGEQFIFPKSIPWPSTGLVRKSSTLNCNETVILKLDDSIEHFFMSNGTLHGKSGRIIPVNEYCLGSVILGNSTLHSGLTCYSGEVSFLCPWRWKIYRACLVISSIFIVGTLIVYIGVNDLRRRIGGMCLISELFALLVSQITLIVLQTNYIESTPGCLTAGVIEIIFVLASFFWLNIMCYDVWSTFRVLRPFSEKVFHAKLFVKYSLYGWGIPLGIGILAVIMEKLDVKLKPDFSLQSGCFFADHNLALHWLYMYGIILVLLLVNLILFIHLAFTLLSNQMEHKKHFKGRSGHSANNPNQDLENLKLYMKLFVIMGIPWLIEVFTSFASKETLCYIWFLDLLNVLRGVFIFIIFVCKKSARDKIIASWCPSYKPKPETSHSQPSRKTSSMSLSSWLSSFHGRKISKVSMTSGGNINLETFKEEEENVIKQEE